MARGIPCISSNCPSGPSDVIQDGRNGWLFPVGDLNALAKRVGAVIENRALLPDPEVVRNSIAKFDIAEVYRRFRGALGETVASSRVS
jgi:UDP-D-galactose:(glucosyl)LPS alpha-1,6-D-galactosyltransferase